MGLDMYGFAKPRKRTGRVNMEAEREDLAYWRKHNALHGWMEDQWINMTLEKYQEITGLGNNEMDAIKFQEIRSGDFNCVDLPLNLEMLLRLAADLQNHNLVPIEGFFFGATDYDPAEKLEADLAFVAKGMQAIKEGKCVFYSSWW